MAFSEQGTNMGVVIDRAFALKFANEWITAWNNAGVPPGRRGGFM